MGFYRKTYFCVCAGQQEELYLKRVAFLLKKLPERVVTFNTVMGQPSRLKKTYTEYDCAALFDYDFNDVYFKNNIQICDKLNNENKQKKRKSGKNVYHAYSNVNFDLWLILHKEDYNRTVFKNDAYIPEVRRVYGLGNNDDIKNRNIICKILEKIELDDIKKAIERATKIREGKISDDKVVLGSTIYYANPDFSIHEFLKKVLIDCGEF